MKGPDVEDDGERRPGAVRPPKRGSGAVAASRRGGLPPWLVALLALLALGILAAVIVVVAHRGSSTTAAAPTSSASTGSTSSAGGPSGASPSPAAASGANGQLTSNGQTLYPAGGAVSPAAGQPVSGSSISVVELAGAPAAGATALDDERFFVGDAANETLVFLHINAEPPFEIVTGQPYTFSGTVRQYTDAAVSGLTDDAKAKAQKAGYYLEITDVGQIHAG